MDWDALAERHEARYGDAMVRLPDDPDRRQRQLARAARAAGAAGLARLMDGRPSEAAGWFARSAARYRESFDVAPPESWGRLIGALKARLLAGDWSGAETDARWALAQGPAESASPIGRYAAVLAGLVLDGDARSLAAGLVAECPDSFPRPVACALDALARHDAAAYAEAVQAVLESFERRDEFLDDVPVADTVLALEALAARRGFAVHPTSALLPE